MSDLESLDAFRARARGWIRDNLKPVGRVMVSLRTLRTDERMTLAAALLTAPGARVTDVALRCGYQSPSKFTAQYRRWFGTTPRERDSRV